MPGSGDLLDARYRLEERVGSGSMGTVWRARDTVLDRVVAVKVMMSALTADPGFLRRFQAEARVMALIDHPGVLRVYDFGETETPDGDTAYLVMEFVVGKTLDEVLLAEGKLEHVRACVILGQALDALEAVHRRGVIHRDLKPSNLMFRPDGRVVLADFGVARSTYSQELTRSSMMLGTVPYLSPEMITNGETTALVDVYAMGIIAYRMLAGVLPFVGDNTAAVMYQHVSKDVAPLLAKLPAETRELVGRALAKEPADRWAGAGIMAVAARAIAEGREVQDLAGTRELRVPAVAELELAAAAGLGGSDGSGGSGGSGTPASAGTMALAIIPAADHAAPAALRRAKAGLLIALAASCAVAIAIGMVLFGGGGTSPASEPVTNATGASVSAIPGTSDPTGFFPPTPSRFAGPGAAKTSTHATTAGATTTKITLPLLLQPYSATTTDPSQTPQPTGSTGPATTPVATTGTPTVGPSSTSPTPSPTAPATTGPRSSPTPTGSSTTTG